MCSEDAYQLGLIGVLFRLRQIASLYDFVSVYPAPVEMPTNGTENLQGQLRTCHSVVTQYRFPGGLNVDPNYRLEYLGKTASY